MIVHVQHGIRRVQFSRSRGYALITSLIFLMILTTVGVFALRNSGLEMKMGANNRVSTQAFEAAEATRTLVNQLIAPHLLSRGWPSSSGGNIDNDIFGRAIPAGLTLNISSADPWYDRPVQTSSSFNPLDLSVVDARYSRNVASPGTPIYLLQGAASVKKLRVDTNTGANAAMNAGYEGMGMSAATGGGTLFFHVLARGEDPNTQAVAYTSSIYRYVIQN